MGSSGGDAAGGADLRFDPARGRLFLRLEGFLPLGEAEAVHRQIVDACDRLRAAGITLAMLADMSNYPAQSREVNAIGERIAATIADTPRTGYAVVTSSALQRLRLRRVLKVAGPRFFENLDEAKGWLDWDDGWPPPGRATK